MRAGARAGPPSIECSNGEVGGEEGARWRGGTRSKEGREGGREGVTRVFSRFCADSAKARGPRIEWRRASQRRDRAPLQPRPSAARSERRARKREREKRGQHSPADTSREEEEEEGRRTPAGVGAGLLRAAAPQATARGRAGAAAARLALAAPAHGRTCCCPASIMVVGAVSFVWRRMRFFFLLGFLTGVGTHSQRLGGRVVGSSRSRLWCWGEREARWKESRRVVFVSVLARGGRVFVAASHPPRSLVLSLLSLSHSPPPITWAPLPAHGTTSRSLDQSWTTLAPR
jgi:hypothetical protein